MEMADRFDFLVAADEVYQVRTAVATPCNSGGPRPSFPLLCSCLASLALTRRALCRCCPEGR